MEIRNGCLHVQEASCITLFLPVLKNGSLSIKNCDRKEQNIAEGEFIVLLKCHPGSLHLSLILNLQEMEATHATGFIMCGTAPICIRNLPQVPFFGRKHPHLLMVLVLLAFHKWRAFLERSHIC